jgi:hypothetical protein
LIAKKEAGTWRNPPLDGEEERNSHFSVANFVLSNLKRRIKRLPRR